MDKLKLYCTDLDGTILTSEKPKDGEFVICVAVKNNKCASFMYNESYDKFLKIISNINTLPITSRCEESYNNIYFKKFFEYALVDNGAKLLHNGEVDIEWLEESRDIINKHKSKEKFEMAKKYIESFGYERKWSTEFVLDYAIRNISEERVNELKSLLSEYSDVLNIRFGKHSVIGTYKCLTKGINIKRFADRYGYELFISSGDSLEDISMFDYTKYSYWKGLDEIKNSSNNIIVFNGDNSSKYNYINWLIDNIYDLVCK